MGISVVTRRDLGETQLAGAEFAQTLVGVDASVVGIAPEELNAVVAHGQGVHGVKVLANGVRVQPADAGNLIDAGGTRALESKGSGGVDAAVAVLPVDDDAASV